MAKSTNTTEKEKTVNETVPINPPIEENITQPTKNSDDPQAYIKENAKKGTGLVDPHTSKIMGEGINVDLTKEK